MRTLSENKELLSQVTPPERTRLTFFSLGVSLSIATLTEGVDVRVTKTSKDGRKTPITVIVLTNPTGRGLLITGTGTLLFLTIVV